jgi:6-phosphogluconate dehydrogenase
VVGAHSVEELTSLLKRPRRVMLMVKAGDTVDQMIEHVLPYLEAGDIVIDGGNSLFTDSNRRTKALADKGILFIGTGVSGGEEGARNGPSIMPGGNPAAWPHVKAIFQGIAAKVEDGTPCCDWVGEDGAGHFVKMVHNGIEYGLMAAYAEGLNILNHANVGEQTHDVDAETTPLRNPELYQFDLNLADIAEVWRRGSVIASWLLDLTAQALLKSPQLTEFSGRVSDSGEGRWTVSAAIDEGVPAPVLSAALYARFSSRGTDDYADKLLSAMRFAFGGHLEKKA